MVSGTISFFWDSKTRRFYPYGDVSNKLKGNSAEHSCGVCVISDWLLYTVQKSLVSVNLWIKHLGDLETNSQPNGMFGVGTAHWVIVSDDYVLIDSMYNDDEKVLMNKEQALYVLEQFKNFLEKKFNDPDRPPSSIDVEFIADGQKAVDMYMEHKALVSK